MALYKTAVADSFVDLALSTAGYSCGLIQLWPYIVIALYMNAVADSFVDLASSTAVYSCGSAQLWP